MASFVKATDVPSIKRHQKNRDRALVAAFKEFWQQLQPYIPAKTDYYNVKLLRPTETLMLSHDQPGWEVAAMYSTQFDLDNSTGNLTITCEVSEPNFPTDEVMPDYVTQGLWRPAEVDICGSLPANVLILQNLPKPSGAEFEGCFSFTYEDGLWQLTAFTPND